MVCPVCTVAVIAGIGILEKLGVNNLIIGLWTGALIVSLIAWTIDYLNRKNIHFLFRKILVILLYYGLIIVPLYYWKVNGVIVMTPLLLWGIIIGTIIFILAILSDKYLRTLNENRAMIKWQKVIIPIAYLIIASIIMYLLIKINTLA